MNSPEVVEVAERGLAVAVQVGCSHRSKSHDVASKVVILERWCRCLVRGTDQTVGLIVRLLD
jgi:hypothetical protein